MAGPARGLMAVIRRLSGPAPDPESDAALLARYAGARDGDAFSAIVRRHGPMVRTVCRRELGHWADADDAFQATFFVLARDAGKVRGESLAGWLYRVAHRAARKQAGRIHRHPAVELGPDDAMTPITPSRSAETHEARAAVGEELAALPDKFRSVLVLCSLEGRTNGEAAVVLGCPVGTVDSRLSTAKAKLKDRLIRRGLAPAVAAGGVASLADPLARAGSTALEPLFETTIPAALRYAATAGSLTDPISTLADGVTMTMNTKLKLIVAAGLATGLVGTTSAGIYFAGGGGSQTKPDARTKADPVKPQPKGESGGLDAGLPAVSADPPSTGTTATTTGVLGKSAGFEEPIDGIPLADLFERLSKLHGVTFRAEQAWFKQQGIPDVYEQKVSIRVTRGLTVQDILEEVAAGLTIDGGDGFPRKVGFRVKGNQVIFGPAFVPASVPGSFRTGDTQLVVPQGEVQKMLYGPTVSLAVKDKTLREIVDLLREQTGANIVLDARQMENLDAKLTLTLNDTKLFSVLKVAGHMCDLAPAVVDNVFYLTDPGQAEKLQKETERNLFGEPPLPPVAIPPGFVTDGVNLYLNPGGLKPAEGLGGGLGGAGVSGFVPATPTPIKPVPVKPEPKDKKQ